MSAIFALTSQILSGIVHKESHKFFHEAMFLSPSPIRSSIPERRSPKYYYYYYYYYYY